ncbi:MAG: hypothetical protein J4A00_00440 [Gammaproteobacteria bacterium]|nr:hypothetical protein [Gammaproteobacteria bacterium]
MLPAVVLGIHLLAAMFWVGGLLFAYLIVRPAVQGIIDPETRFQLWLTLFSRFLPMVWVAIGVLFGSGLWLTYAVYGGFGGVGPAIHTMIVSGVLMTLLFAYLFVVLYPGLRRSVVITDFAAAAGYLAGIRRIVAINSLLGLFTVCLGAVARYV